jgi:hypothetical protein
MIAAVVDFPHCLARTRARRVIRQADFNLMSLPSLNDSDKTIIDIGPDESKDNDDLY